MNAELSREQNRKEEVFNTDDSGDEAKHSGESLDTLSKRLIQAIQHENMELFRQLIDRKGVVNAADNVLKQTSLFYAAIVKNEDVGLEMVRAIIEKGGNVNHQDYINQTPLFYASRDGKTRVVEFLISKGSHPYHKDKNEQSPLYYASREGQVETLKLLIKHGADVNETDIYNQTALFYAAKHGRLAVCKYLVEQGINYNHFDSKKQTALFYARKGKHKDVVDYLQALGKEGSKKQSTISKAPVVDEPTQPTILVNNVSSISAAPTDKSKKKKREKESKTAYYLIFRDENGTENELTMEEFEKFKQEYPQIADLLLNPYKIPDTEGGREREHWEKIARKIMHSLWKIPGATIFYEPVDPKKLKIEDYFTIIKHPMDFGTIKNRLSKGQYQSPEEFDHDLKLVFDNCIQYNGSFTEIGSIGVKIGKEYENLMKTTGFDTILQKSREDKGRKNSMHTEDPQPKIEESVKPSENDQEFPGLFDEGIKDEHSEFNLPKSENVDIKMESQDLKLEGFEGYSQTSLLDQLNLMNQPSQKSFADDGEHRAQHEPIFEGSNTAENPNAGNNPNENQEEKMDIENEQN